MVGCKAWAMACVVPAVTGSGDADADDDDDDTVVDMTGNSSKVQYTAIN